VLAGPAHVGGQLAQHGGKPRQIGVGEAAAQLGVEGDRGLPQPQERGLARLGQRDHLDTAVGGIPGAGDQAAGVHRVEVVRQRGLADPDGFRQLALVSWLPDLQVEQDEPDGEGAARFGEGLVKGALHGTGRLVQAQPDRDWKRFWHADQPITTHRSLSV
jgi:hypothetical protein